MKVVELRDIARSRGLKGWYRLRKSDLISFIISEKQRQQREIEEAQRQEEQQVERRRQERLEKATAEAKTKADKKSKSKARRQAKREESKREAERRAEVKRVESNQRKQRAKTLPERDQAVKRQNPKESNDNGWKDKRSRLRPSAKLMNRHRKRILRKIGRKRSVSTER